MVSDEEADEARFRALTGALPGSVTFEWAGTFESALDAMTAGGFDAYLVACRLGETERPRPPSRVSRRGGGCAGDHAVGCGPSARVDLRAMESGAADYLVEARARRGPARTVDPVRGRERRGARRPCAGSATSWRPASPSGRTALETLNEALAAEVAERRAAERALREADRRKDAFFATLAHELRNPLAPLSSAAEILSRTGDTPEEKERGGARSA